MEIQIKVGVVIVKDDKILLLKEWSDTKKDYRWNIIKGTFEDTDKTILNCVKREAKEEAGVEVKIDKFICCIVKHGFNIRIYYNFLGQINKGEPKLAVLKEQEARKENFKEIRWFSTKELEKMEEDDFMNDVVYKAITDWVNGRAYPMELMKEIVLNN